MGEDERSFQLSVVFHTLVADLKLWREENYLMVVERNVFGKDRGGTDN